MRVDWIGDRMNEEEITERIYDLTHHLSIDMIAIRANLNEEDIHSKKNVRETLDEAKERIKEIELLVNTAD